MKSSAMNWVEFRFEAEVPMSQASSLIQWCSTFWPMGQMSGGEPVHGPDQASIPRSRLHCFHSALCVGIGPRTLHHLHWALHGRIGPCGPCCLHLAPFPGIKLQDFTPPLTSPTCWDWSPGTTHHLSWGPCTGIQPHSGSLWPHALWSGP